MVPPIDPASTAALVAELAAMADDRVFLLQSAATSKVSLLQRRYPVALALRPQPGEQAYVVGYRMLYRRQVFAGQLVVAAANIGMAEGILALDAQFIVRTYDVRNPVTEYTPGGSGVNAGP